MTDRIDDLAGPKAVAWVALVVLSVALLVLVVMALTISAIWSSPIAQCSGGLLLMGIIVACHAINMFDASM
jgi:hypothetical protein